MDRERKRLGRELVIRAGQASLCLFYFFPFCYFVVCLLFVPFYWLSIVICTNYCKKYNVIFFSPYMSLQVRGSSGVLFLTTYSLLCVCVLQVCSHTQITVLRWSPAQLSDVAPVYLPQDAPCKPPLLVQTQTHIYINFRNSLSDFV